MKKLILLVTIILVVVSSSYAFTFYTDGSNSYENVSETSISMAEDENFVYVSYIITENFLPEGCYVSRYNKTSGNIDTGWSINTSEDFSFADNSSYVAPCAIDISDTEVFLTGNDLSSDVQIYRYTLSNSNYASTISYTTTCFPGGGSAYPSSLYINDANTYVYVTENGGYVNKVQISDSTQDDCVSPGTNVYWAGSFDDGYMYEGAFGTLYIATLEGTQYSSANDLIGFHDYIYSFFLGSSGEYRVCSNGCKDAVPIGYAVNYNNGYDNLYWATDNMSYVIFNNTTNWIFEDGGIDGNITYDNKDFEVLILDSYNVSLNNVTLHGTSSQYSYGFYNYTEDINISNANLPIFINDSEVLSLQINNVNNNNLRDFNITNYTIYNGLSANLVIKDSSNTSLNNLSYNNNVNYQIIIDSSEVVNSSFLNVDIYIDPSNITSSVFSDCTINSTGGGNMYYNNSFDNCTIYINGGNADNWTSNNFTDSLIYFENDSLSLVWSGNTFSNTYEGSGEVTSAKTYYNTSSEIENNWVTFWIDFQQSNEPTSVSFELNSTYYTMVQSTNNWSYSLYMPNASADTNISYSYNWTDTEGVHVLDMGNLTLTQNNYTWLFDCTVNATLFWGETVGDTDGGVEYSDVTNISIDQDEIPAGYFYITYNDKQQLYSSYNDLYNQTINKSLHCEDTDLIQQIKVMSYSMPINLARVSAWKIVSNEWVETYSIYTGSDGIAQLEIDDGTEYKFEATLDDYTGDLLIVKVPALNTIKYYLEVTPDEVGTTGYYTYVSKNPVEESPTTVTFTIRSLSAAELCYDYYTNGTFVDGSSSCVTGTSNTFSLVVTNETIANGDGVIFYLGGVQVDEFNLSWDEYGNRDTDIGFDRNLDGTDLMTTLRSSNEYMGFATILILFFGIAVGLIAQSSTGQAEMGLGAAFMFYLVVAIGGFTILYIPVLIMGVMIIAKMVTKEEGKA